MNRFVIFLIALVFTACVAASMTGCSVAQVKAKVEADIVHTVAAAAAPVAKPDLQKAAQESAAAGDTEGAACATAISTELDALLSSGSGGFCLNPLDAWNPATQKCDRAVIGIATAIAQQRIAARAPPPAPMRIPDTLIKACAVVVFDMKVTFAEFFAQFGVDVAKLYGGAAFGSAQTLSLIKAAQAAQASGH
jgi:hypothetical protein